MTAAENAREEANMTGDSKRPGFRLLPRLRGRPAVRRGGSTAAPGFLLATAGLCLALGAGGPARGGGPEGQITWGVHVTMAPTWFDPAETPGIITPYMVLYALHDGLAKPMPGQPLAPSLAESWSASEDALTYEFVLRPGVKFHNGDPVRAEDVKFSSERYPGAAPYKFVSFTPGRELVLEAFDQYWRKMPNVRRLVFRDIPDEATRLAALKRGEVDIVYSIRGELAEELQRTQGLTLKPTYPPAPFWLYFADQWDPKSPWRDQRGRLPATLPPPHHPPNQPPH